MAARTVTACRLRRWQTGSTRCAELLSWPPRLPNMSLALGDSGHPRRGDRGTAFRLSLGHWPMVGVAQDDRQGPETRVVAGWGSEANGPRHDGNLVSGFGAAQPERCSQVGTRRRRATGRSSSRVNASRMIRIDACLPAPVSESATHGFLFADLRGYTQLTESRGATEASRLLDRYRSLTRNVVLRHGGAEIKTEGDSFYVVLPSASIAVRCGLDLIGDCASPPDGGEPIPVGVGIHAGEAVAHEDAFVGSAVNIAARVCAAAGSGELLATGTVRELTRSVVPARFVPVGRRALKGIAEPVELYRVVPEGTPGPSQVGRRLPLGIRPRASAWLVLAVVTVLIVGLGGVITVAQAPAASNAASHSPFDDGSPGASSAPSAATASAGDGAFPNVDEAALLARLPPSIATWCVRASNPAPAANASLTCEWTTDALPDVFEILWFADQPIIAPTRIDRLAADKSLPDGDCAGGLPGHGSWGGGSVPIGRIACFKDRFGGYWIHWSYDREGILVRISGRPGTAGAIYDWWKSNAGQLLGPASP